MKTGSPVVPFSTNEIVEVISQVRAPVQARIAGTAVLEASLTVAIAI